MLNSLLYHASALFPLETWKAIEIYARFVWILGGIVVAVSAGLGFLANQSSSFLERQPRSAALELATKNVEATKSLSAFAVLLVSHGGPESLEYAQSIAKKLPAGSEVKFFNFGTLTGFPSPKGVVYYEANGNDASKMIDFLNFNKIKAEKAPFNPVPRPVLRDLMNYNIIIIGYK